MALGGAFLRFGSFGLRVIEFCCAAIGLGFFSYFLSVLADRNLNIANRWLATEGITGAATLYTLIAAVFVLCLGGKAFFGFIGVFLDICFVGAYIAVAWFTRHGANSCSGYVRTPLGNGQASSHSTGFGNEGFGFENDDNATYAVSLHTACVFNTVVFATAIINIFLFLISAFLGVMMVRHHKKEKKFGPSPANNYTKGSGKAPFWKRGRRARGTKDVETTGTLYNNNNRMSNETGTTLGNGAGVAEPKFGQPGYGQTGTYHDRSTGNF